MKFGCYKLTVNKKIQTTEEMRCTFFFELTDLDKPRLSPNHINYTQEANTTCLT